MDQQRFLLETLKKNARMGKWAENHEDEKTSWKIKMMYKESKKWGKRENLLMWMYSSYENEKSIL